MKTDQNKYKSVKYNGCLGGDLAMKITKVTKKYFETEGERVYFFEPLEEGMTVKELQELMDEHEKFILEQIRNMRKEKKNEAI